MEKALVTRALETLWLDRDLKTFYEISIFWARQKMTKSDILSTILTRVLVILFQMMNLKVLSSIWWHSKVDQAWNNMSKASQSNGISSFSVIVLVKQDTTFNLTWTWVKKKAQKKIWDQVLFWKWLNPFKTLTVHSLFYDFHNSPSLLVKLWGSYGTGTAWEDRKGMPEMPVDTKVEERGFRVLVFRQFSLL